MRVLTFIILTIFMIPVFAGDKNILELSLSLDKTGGSRLVDPEEVIDNFIGKGIFGKSASDRMDYSDYYIPKKKVTVIGARLVLFEYEYVQEYRGCCFNPGIAVVLLANAEIANIESFSRKNKCSFSKEALTDDPLIKRALKNITIQPNQTLVSLSCKENNIRESSPN